jgi:hypothetical protein
VTVAHEGPKSGTDTALSLHASTASPSVSLQASALAGYSHGIQRAVAAGQTLAIAAQDSVWDPAGDQLGSASAGPFHELGDVHVEPALVNLAGRDLRPRGSSAQIDLDSVADTAGYTDLLGTSTVDGNGDGSPRPDAGALEYRHLPPRIVSISAPAGADAGTPLTFDSAVSDADGDHVQVRWDFGDGTGADTSSATHTYAALGSYQATLTATDEAGLTDRRTFTVMITAAPVGATGVPPAGTPAAGSPAKHRLQHHAGAHRAARHAEPDLRQASRATAPAPECQRSRDDLHRPQPSRQRTRHPSPGNHAQRARRQQCHRACTCAAPTPAPQGWPADPDDRRKRRSRASHLAPHAAAHAAAVATGDDQRRCQSIRSRPHRLAPISQWRSCLRRGRPTTRFPLVCWL